MSDSLQITWTELAGALGIASTMVGLLVNYLRVSLLNSVHRLIEEKLRDHPTKNEMHLILRAELSAYERRRDPPHS